MTDKVTKLIGEFILFIKGMGIWGEYKRIMYNNIECYRPFFKNYRSNDYALNYEEETQCYATMKIVRYINKSFGFYYFLSVRFNNVIVNPECTSVNERFCYLLFFAFLKNTRSGYYNLGKLQMWCDLFCTYLKERGIFDMPIEQKIIILGSYEDEIKAYLSNNKVLIWKY